MEPREPEASGAPESAVPHYFLSRFFFCMNSSVTFHPTYLSSDLLQIQVQIHPMPAHFLGAAFDMVLDGDWKFERFELCGDLANDKNVLQLVAAHPAEHKIIAGISVPDAREKVRTGNCLGTLTFHLSNSHHTPSRVDFDHGYLSVYNNGRHDLPQTTWQSLQLPRAGALEQETLQNSGYASLSQEVKGVSAPAVAQSNVLLPFDTPLARFYETMGLFLLLSLLFFLLSALYYYFRGASRDEPSKKG